MIAWYEPSNFANIGIEYIIFSATTKLSGAPHIADEKCIKSYADKWLHTSSIAPFFSDA